MRAVIRAAVVAVVVVTVTGCSTWSPVKSADGRQVQTERFTYQVPQGWSYRVKHRDEISLTRDGPTIQGVGSRWYEWDRPFFYADVERARLQRSELPIDVAQQILAARQRQEGIDVLEVLSLSPAMVAGSSGFRAAYTYRSPRGIGYSGVSYGAIRGEGVYLITFEAPSTHFYDRDLPTFERIVTSLRSGGAGVQRR